MSGISDFESVISDIIISPCSSLDDNDINTIDHSKNITINIHNVPSTSDCIQHDVSLTESEQSLLETPKILNASSPSSICSTKPLEWDSGADVGYDMSNQQNHDLSTIERIAMNSLVYNANSTPYKKKVNIHTKSNSLINLNGINLFKEKKSASFEALPFTALKSNTLPKCRSPMASSLSVSTVVHKLKLFNTINNKQPNKKHIDLILNQQEKKLESLNIESNYEQKSSHSSKESNSTLGSADTAGSWVAKEFHNSTNTTTDRVNSFEYLSGNAYYRGRNNELEDYSDKEIKQSTKMLVEAMKANGLTSELQRKEIFKEIIETFLKNYNNVHKDLPIKSTSDTDETPIRQDFTSQTSNTANTIVNNKKNNNSSTITFTSPITSSRYGDDFDSKYDEFSMDSGRHIDLQKCKSKKICTPSNKQKNQSVQCTFPNSFTNIYKNKNAKEFSSTKPNTINKNKDDLEFYSKIDDQSKPNCNDLNKEFKKQMIWFHTNYMKTERENQMLWINSQISHLKNLKKLLNTHEELKKNWNSYKQKQTNKMCRQSTPSTSSSSSKFTTTNKSNSTISSKQYSDASKLDLMTDAESSTTICDHVHYKKGIIFDEPNSIKNCCRKTLFVIDEKQKKDDNKFKAILSHPLKVNEMCSKNNTKGSSQSGATYSVDHQLQSTNNKSSISYDIIFKPSSKYQKKTNLVNNKSIKNQQNSSVSVACQTIDVPLQPQSSLKEYLMMNRPDYICQVKERQNILSKIARLRSERKTLKRDFLLTNNCENQLPPNPLAVKRIMSQKEMRKLTERNYRKCPEVKNKKIVIKRKEEYATNKIMANLFNKKLQKKTLNGKVDLSNSVSVCSL